VAKGHHPPHRGHVLAGLGRQPDGRGGTTRALRGPTQDALSRFGDPGRSRTLLEIDPASIGTSSDSRRGAVIALPAQLPKSADPSEPLLERAHHLCPRDTILARRVRQAGDMDIDINAADSGIDSLIQPRSRSRKTAAPRSRHSRGDRLHPSPVRKRVWFTRLGYRFDDGHALPRGKPRNPSRNLTGSLNHRRFRRQSHYAPILRIHQNSEPWGTNENPNLRDRPFPTMNSSDKDLIDELLERHRPRRQPRFAVLRPHHEIIRSLRQRRASFDTMVRILAEMKIVTSDTSLRLFCIEVLGESRGRTPRQRRSRAPRRRLEFPTSQTSVSSPSNAPSVAGHPVNDSKQAPVQPSLPIAIPPPTVQPPSRGPRIARIKTRLGILDRAEVTQRTSEDCRPPAATFPPTTPSPVCV
jgi:hypothetical protein